MSKIIVFTGSPRKDGYTAQLIEEVIQGAKSKGAELKVYDLNSPGVKGCQGCFYCRTHEGCATQDYLQPMYEDLKAAHAILFSAPVYFHQISGQAKQWLDRMYPMIDASFTPRYPQKKVVTIFAQASPEQEAFPSGLNAINHIFTLFGWKLTDSILCSNTGAAGFKPSASLLQQAFAAGEALAQ